MNISFQALGCRLNEAELESWASQFMKLGHQVCIDSTDADLVVFNSCAVTSEADRKSRQRINKLRQENPDAKLVVTGCHASLNIEAVKNYLGVDMVVGNADKEALVDRILEGFNIEVIENTGHIDNTLFLRGRHRAFIKVQDGCRYRCSYCIVTIARGAERSRSIDEIVTEINNYHHSGVQEIALTGVHVGGYGSDNGSSLYALLSEILARTEVPRIRLASVEPWDLPANFFGLFQNQRLMPHMHLPIQSGCDDVLKRMSRRCNTVEFSRLVEKAREAIPLFNITTDIIVGFPGETDQEWQQTMRYIEGIGFGHVHIFPFSPRKGTRAAMLSDQIDNATKKARSKELHELAATLKRKELEQHIGNSASVLWEQKTGTGQWLGYTPHYHRVMSGSSACKESEISQVRLDQVDKCGSLLLNRAAEVSIPVEFN
ncbi:MAG: tRNA (N(6)-L-threonylcarbamoyladenosine(37)-C(2))-methylthiotransferase MtaB [Gammaproteobacteria bacterium]|nr:tRNA (N(6)-L-threonylcarbamoyladenosine(37)-C(2))-methylthiotransferase MtaB [Gammaproteobacteria bacterium]